MTFIGKPIRRFEDERLVQGHGRYAADHSHKGQAHLVTLRSPHAHARIVGIDAAAAKRHPGVLLVRTGADYAAEGLAGPQPQPPVLGRVSRVRGRMITPPNRILPTERVRYVGEPVAIVVAETEAIGREALELIEVSYEVLPAVVELDRALEAGAPQIWVEAPRNLCCELDIGDRAACDAAFAGAAHVVSLDAVNNRINGCPMEPRSALGSFDPVSGVLTLITGTQMPNVARDKLAEEVFHVPREKVRVISPDMGGGFGTRAQCFPEFVFVLWCARDLKRPVKWQGDRSEVFLSDPHARDNVSQAALALDRDGRILGLRVRQIANLGAYPGMNGPLVPVSAGPRVQTGAYKVPALHVDVSVVFTNTCTVAPYRGAGQPEAIYLMERLLDLAAIKTGIDRIEIRRRNVLSAADFPYQTAAGGDYDSGDYPAAMDIALRQSDWPGFAARRSAAKGRGKLRGIGFANYVQVSGAVPFEWGHLIIQPAGVAEFRVGTHSHGQSHETTYMQVLADGLQLPLAQVKHVQGDTARVLEGTGTIASRSLFKAGQIIGECTTTVIGKARRLAAIRFGVEVDRTEYQEGQVRVPGTNFVASLFELSAMGAAGKDLPPELAGPLAHEVHHKRPEQNYPSGTHVCEVEVDPETGHVELVSYT
ncbi:MAG: xanthine dehydrogenase family protein molybdopterin-binding subunit, partial [Alphaproteobacteria bacterium]|nr:xanthine dehydrogenase family protein molybdopterin-binding subunit [Alphaproteobacteria bacterium]